jgi:hypothetical protein
LQITGTATRFNPALPLQCPFDEATERRRMQSNAADDGDWDNVVETATEALISKVAITEGGNYN